MSSAIRVLVSRFGILVGLAGIEHGLGEVLQGNVAPSGLMITAWPGWELFRVLAWEPAFTVVPNLLLTGFLAIFLSLAYLAWATTRAERKDGGLVLLLLAIAMFLAGAGYGTAVLGIIVGLVATRINVREARWLSRLPAGIGRASVKFWPWAYAACVSTWLALLPGTLILAYAFGADRVIPARMPLILAAFGALLLAVVTGFVRDGQNPAAEGSLANGPAATAKAYCPGRRNRADQADNSAEV